MPQGHKVRLGDGSVIQLDRAGLKAWYRKGLITPDSPVQRPGSGRWVPLAEVLDDRPSPPPRNVPPPARSSRRRRSRSVPLRPILTAVAVLGLAGAGWWTAPQWWPAVRGLVASGPPAAAPPSTTPAPPSPLAQAVAAVMRDAPHLSPRTAEMLMRESAAGVLDPPEAFRRAYLLTAEGLKSLTPAEAREFGALNSAAYAGLAPADRRRLGGYIDRVRGRRPTRPEEDAAMSRLMRTAVLKLPAARRLRLQALFEKAVASALGAPATASR